MKNKPYPLYTNIPDVSTIKELVDYGVGKGKDNKLFIYTYENKEYIETFYGADRAIKEFGEFLFDKGLNNHDKIAVVGENSYQWVITYFSVVNGGNILVPLDKDMDRDVLADIVKISGCRAIVYSDKYKDIIDVIKEKGDSEIEYFLPMTDFFDYLEKGAELRKEGKRDFENAVVTPEDLATIVFTSGTTGRSKGVMLTHRNLIADVLNTCRMVTASHSILALPLNHTFSWASALLAAFVYVEYGYICPDLKSIVKDFQKHKPQNFSAVPLVVETIYKRVWNTAREQGKDKKLRVGLKISNTLLKLGIDARRTIFKEVLGNLGGELSLIICGGASMDPEYQEGLYEMGIQSIIGYGITECSPVVTVNRNNYSKLGSAGLPLPCNEIKIHDPDEEGIGEIYIRGENVMVGYYNNPEATKEAFDGDWFKSGDYGRIDEDGFLFITGRKKNLIILSNGKNISPEEIEDKLVKIDFVSEVLVYEEDRQITAEFFLDEEHFPDARNMLHAAVSDFNKSVAACKNVTKIKIRDEEFPKTTTMKIKRNYTA